MINKFSSKQIVTGVIVFLAVVVVIGYIISSIVAEDKELSEKGVTKDTKPPQTREAWMAGAKTGNEFFDPTKKDSSPSTKGKLSTTNRAECTFDSQDMKVTCEAYRTSMQSTLNWFEDSTETTLSGEEEGIFEFSINNISESKVLVTLEECVSTACKQSETSVDVSVDSK